MQLNCEVSGRRVAHIFFFHISVVVFLLLKAEGGACAFLTSQMFSMVQCCFGKMGKMKSEEKKSVHFNITCLFLCAGVRLRYLCSSCALCMQIACLSSAASLSATLHT